MASTMRLASSGSRCRTCYSPELSLFVLDAGIRFLEEDDPPGLLYLTLTDYVQHTFAPEHPQALEFYHALDQRLARLEQLGATVAVTADPRHA